MRITSFLNRCGFKATNADHAVFTKNGIIIAIYMDNLCHKPRDSIYNGVSKI